MQNYMSLTYDRMRVMSSEELVDSSLEKHFKQLACSSWNEAKRAEYDELYPTHRVVPNTEGIDIEVPIDYTYCVWQAPVLEVIAEDGKVTPSSEGMYLPVGCTPTYEQWLDGEVCPEYDTADDIANFKDTDSKYKPYHNRPYLEYLTKTDYYVTRFAETGKVIPVDVLDERQLAREAIL